LKHVHDEVFSAIAREGIDFRMMRYTEQVVQNHLEFMWDELMRTYEEYVETPITYLIRYIKRREAKK